MRMLLHILLSLGLLCGSALAARDFNGSTDRVQGASATTLRYPMTVGGWIYLDTLPDSSTMMSSGNAGFQGSVLSSTTAITTGTNYYIAIVITATNIRFLRMTAAGTTTFEDVAHSQTDNDGWAFYVHSNTNLAVNFETGAGTTTNVGVYTGGSGLGLDGRIAHAQVWDVALTDAELVAAARGSAVQHHKLLRWYEIVGVSSPEPDWSLTPANGTLTGTARIDHPPGLGFPLMASHRVLRTPAAGPPSVAPKMMLMGVGP